MATTSHSHSVWTSHGGHVRSTRATAPAGALKEIRPLPVTPHVAQYTNRVFLERQEGEMPYRAGPGLPGWPVLLGQTGRLLVLRLS